MPILLLVAGLAHAADTSPYPLQAAVDLPAEGVMAIHVPLGLRTPEDPPDASDLLLVGPDGQVVPVARVATSTHPEVLRAGSNLWLTPTLDPNAWEIDVRGRPVDSLDVHLPGDAATATATVEARRDGRWVPLGEPKLLWTYGGAWEGELPLPQPTSGTLRVNLRWRTPRRAGQPQVTATVLPGPRVPWEHPTVPVHDWRLQEDGFARYDLYLPRAWPVDHLVLHPTDPLFARQAGAASLEDGRAGSLSFQLVAAGRDTIQRVHLAGTDIERTTVSQMPPPTDRLAVLVRADGKPPLHIPAVEAWIPGARLLVQDPGPGPFVLYGGAPRGTSPPSDLGAATAELARLASTVVDPGAVKPNPDFVPPEVQGHLVGPSTKIDLARFQWAHAVTGPKGLVKIPVPPEALAQGRSDLADLRLVDAQGDQIPYVLRRRPGEADHRELQVTRKERGKKSILEAKLPVGDVPVSVVRLTTSAPVFSRQVSIARKRGARLETLRVYQWIGDERPGVLDLEVDAAVGDELVVTIDNGDNPPLPVDAIEASWPGWELVAGLPEGGARLVYGDPTATTPRYDLSLIRTQIRRRVAVVATVGPQERLSRPPLSWSDRLLLVVGIGFLALGLVALTVRLIIATPKPPEPC